MYLTDGSAVILLDTDAEPNFPIGGHSRTHTWCLTWKKVANEIYLEANTLQVPICVTYAILGLKSSTALCKDSCRVERANLRQVFKPLFI